MCRFVYVRNTSFLFFSSDACTGVVNAHRCRTGADGRRLVKRRPRVLVGYGSAGLRGPICVLATLPTRDETLVIIVSKIIIGSTSIARWRQLALATGSCKIW